MELGGTGAYASTVGKLLEEVSWEKAKNYRAGGRGLENVLTAEVLLGLDFLPRRAFLGEIFQSAHGALSARNLCTDEAAAASLHFLPGELEVQPGPGASQRVVVQPDAIIQSPSAYVLVEAKRIRSSAFQPEQLAREYLALLANAGGAVPVLLLLGVEPPVAVKGRGHFSVEDAIEAFLEPVLHRVGDEPGSVAELMARIPEVCCWITWREVADCVERALQQLVVEDPAVRASVERIARFVTNAISWHA